MSTIIKCSGSEHLRGANAKPIPSLKKNHASPLGLTSSNSLMFIHTKNATGTEKKLDVE